tara:strand:+ start:3829 stop:4122 length:294 start_codon:yes stop_codon:yes gene_type:complete
VLGKKSLPTGFRGAAQFGEALALTSKEIFTVGIACVVDQNRRAVRRTPGWQGHAHCAGGLTARWQGDVVPAVDCADPLGISTSLRSADHGRDGVFIH